MDIELINARLAYHRRRIAILESQATHWREQYGAECRDRGIAKTDAQWSAWLKKQEDEK